MTRRERELREHDDDDDITSEVKGMPLLPRAAMYEEEPIGAREEWEIREDEGTNEQAASGGGHPKALRQRSNRDLRVCTSSRQSHPPPSATLYMPSSQPHYVKLIMSN